MIKHKEFKIDDYKFAEIWYLKELQSENISFFETYLLHNIDNPAIIYYDSFQRKAREVYCDNNVIHNAFGPAEINYFYKDKGIIPNLIINKFYFKGEEVKVSSIEEFKKVMVQINLS